MTQVYEHHPLTHTTRTMPQLIKFKYNTPPPINPPVGQWRIWRDDDYMCVRSTVYE